MIYLLKGHKSYNSSPFLASLTVAIILLPLLLACGDSSSTASNKTITPTLIATPSPTTGPAINTPGVPVTPTNQDISSIHTTSRATNTPSVIDIRGIEWHLNLYKTEQNTLEAPLNDRKITLLFSSDGKITGHSGCNMYFGNYQFDLNSIIIKELSSTAMACLQNQIMEQENIFLKDLRNVRGYEVTASELNLKDQNGDKLLVFTN
jgi:heat shock protein HslJ